MMLAHWCRQVLGGLSRQRRPGAIPRPLRFIPRLEILEDRLTPSPLIVTSATDSAVPSSGTLRAAIAAANPGDTIAFDSSLNHQTIKLTLGRLDVNKNLDIEGPGASLLSISGNSVSQVFAIGSGATVTIAGLTIANGSDTTKLIGGGGGGIDNAGNLTLRDCVLSGNQTSNNATTTDPLLNGGGGILNEVGGSLILDHSTLTDNIATTSAAAAGMHDVFGGGLLNEGSATVLSCLFDGNQVLGGGGISFFAASVGGGIDNFGGTLSVTGSTFTNNQALGSGAGNFGIGGALESNAGFLISAPLPSTASIDNCTFTDNVAGGATDATGLGVAGNAGGVDNEGTGAIMTLSNSLFQHNEVRGGEGGFGVGGGLMNFFGSTLSVFNTQLIRNLADGVGKGATNNGGGIDNQTATMILSHSTLLDNEALGGPGGHGTSPGTSGEAVGGGIMNVFGGVLTVLDSTLTGNQAIGGDNADTSPLNDYPINGGALGGGITNASSSTLTLKDTTLSDNVARGGSNSEVGSPALGGGIQNNGSRLTVIDSTFAGNQAIGGNGISGGGFGSGGGLDDSTKPHSALSSSALILDSTFTGNEALGGAGGSGSNGGPGVGGGISVGSYSLADFTDHSVLTISNSPLDQNDAQGGNGGPGGNGGEGLGAGLAIQLFISAGAPVANFNLAITLANGSPDLLSVRQLEQNGPWYLGNSADVVVTPSYPGNSVNVDVAENNEAVQVSVFFALQLVFGLPTAVAIELPPSVAVAQGTSLPGADLALVAVLVTGGPSESLPASNTAASAPSGEELFALFLPPVRGQFLGEANPGGTASQDFTEVVGTIARVDLQNRPAFQRRVDETLRQRLLGRQVSDRIEELLQGVKDLLDQLPDMPRPQTALPDPEGAQPPPAEAATEAAASDQPAEQTAETSVVPQEPVVAAEEEGELFAHGELLPSSTASQLPLELVW